MRRINRGAPVGKRWVRPHGAAHSRDVSARTVMTIVAAVGAFYLAAKVAYRLREVVLLLAVAGFIALVLNPLVVAFQQRLAVRRALAVAIVGVGAALVLGGLTAAFGYPLARGMTHLTRWLPGYVAAADHGKGWIGHLARRYHLQTWVQRNAPRLVNVGQSMARPSRSEKTRWRSRLRWQPSPCLSCFCCLRDPGYAWEHSRSSPLGGRLVMASWRAR